MRKYTLFLKVSFLLGFGGATCMAALEERESWRLNRPVLEPHLSESEKQAIEILAGLGSKKDHLETLDGQSNGEHKRKHPESHKDSGPIAPKKSFEPLLSAPKETTEKSWANNKEEKIKEIKNFFNTHYYDWCKRKPIRQFTLKQAIEILLNPCSNKGEPLDPFITQEESNHRDFKKNFLWDFLNNNRFLKTERRSNNISEHRLLIISSLRQLKEANPHESFTVSSILGILGYSRTLPSNNSLYRFVRKKLIDHGIYKACKNGRKKKLN